MTLLRQSWPSPGNGVCVPQRVYGYGTGRDNSQTRDLEFFFRGDGSYLPVKEALENNYGSHGLMGRDSPALVGAGLTLTVRFEVKKLAISCDPLTFIGCTVARIRIQGLPGESAEVALRGWGLRSRISVANSRLARTHQEDHPRKARQGGCHAR